VDISSLPSTSALWKTASSSTTPAPKGPEKTMKAVADLLGMDADSLKEALKSGKTMSDLAKTAGVSQDDLVATIQATLPAQAPDGTSMDTGDLASKIATGQLQGPPPKPPVDAANGLDALSSSLGVSSDELLQRLTDGTGISDLLAANPDVAAQLADAQNKGAVVDGYA
jgi:uncharacterized protein YidB (DUF937 family)